MQPQVSLYNCLAVNFRTQTTTCLISIDSPLRPQQSPHSPVCMPTTPPSVITAAPEFWVALDYVVARLTLLTDLTR